MKFIKHLIKTVVLAGIVLTSSTVAHATQVETGNGGAAAPNTEAIAADSSPVTMDAAGEAFSKNYFYNRDVEFKGSFSADRMYISVDEYWKVNGLSLHLTLSVSELAKYSALTVYVNNKPVHSEMLVPTGGQKRLLETALPVDVLQKGSNEVRVEVSNTQAIAACVDDQHNGVWVLLNKASYIQLDFEEQAASKLVKEFPYPFIKASGSLEKTTSVILIADQADEEETAAALQVAASLGLKSNGSEEVDMDIVPYSQLPESERSNRDIIFVGKMKNLPAEIRSKTPQDVAAKASEGALLYRIESPYNAKKIVMGIVTDRDDGMLDTASKLMLNEDLITQIDSDIGYIAHGTDVSTTAPAQKDQMTLVELGYQGGIYLNGPYRQQTSIGVKLTSNRMVLPGAKATLNIRYARNIDFDKSLVTVYINNTPVGSKKLEPEKADGDVLEVNIPNNAINTNYMEMRVAFDLQMTNGQCVRIDNDTPWGYIDPVSSLYLPTKDERALVLENYPWPFIKDGKWNEVAVVLPDESPLRELDFLTDMFVYMGTYLQDNTGTLRVIKQADFSDKYRDSHFIVAGIPEQQPQLRSLNDSLWFKYDESFSHFLSNEKRRLLEDFSRNLASIQLVTSPFDLKHSVLVVTAPKEENFDNAKKYLTASRFAGTMMGNALLIDRWENMTNHYFTGNDSLSLTDKVSMSSTQLKIFAVMFVTVMLMLIIGVTLYVRKFRRR